MQILISTSNFNLNNFFELESLKATGIVVTLNPFGTRLTPDQTTELLGDDTMGLIAGLESLTEPILQAAKSLKVIARVGTGLDSVDLAAAKRLGIKVFNTPDAPTSAVAELTIGHILGLIRNITSTDRAIREKTWKGQMGSLLETKTVGIIGFGRIGQRVANMISAFGAKVIVCDPNAKSETFTNVSLDEIFKLANVVTLHVPYDAATHHLVGKRQLATMQSGSYLINISRGGLVDEDALLDSLKTGHLAGAALDCFEHEPYSGPLSKLNNVQMTAHMGTYARETRDRMEQEASRLLVTSLRESQLIK